MSLLIWRANAARRHPQITSVGALRSLGSFGTIAAAATTGRMRRQFIQTMPLYNWANNQSTLGGNKQGDAPLTLRPVTTVAGIVEHYDVGTEADILYLVPVLAGEASISSKLTDVAVSLVASLTVTANLARQSTGAFTLVTALTASAHTETGGNVSASGVLRQVKTLTGTGTLKHVSPQLNLLTLAPSLTASVQLNHLAVGSLILQTSLSSAVVKTSVGSLVLEPTLSGEAFRRVQSGLWVVIPEDERGWTVQ